MGRAIVRDPAAFLMDEPLSNLDAKLRIQTRAEILRIQRRLGTTTVYVTHDQTEAMTLGDRLAVMRDGVLLQVGTPDELYNRPRNVFVAGFIGAPAMNFLPGEIADGSLRFPLATVPLADARNGGLRPPTPEGQVLVGIRPEDFEDAALAGERAHGTRIKALVDVLESTGSDVYAHPSLDARNGEGPLDDRHVREVQAAVAEADHAAAPASPEVIARLDSTSRIAEGGELWMDTSRLHLFDPETGERLES
jgi:multiple sugar transport system ATP-binding protein